MQRVGKSIVPVEAMAISIMQVRSTARSEKSNKWHVTCCKLLQEWDGQLENLSVSQMNSTPSQPAERILCYLLTVNTMTQVQTRPLGRADGANGIAS